MSVSGIHGQLLEVTVVGCNNLKNTEWRFTTQDPYIILEYASDKRRTRTCTGGGINPAFQEKFTFTLIEGLREFSVLVWNSNTLTSDYFIGSGKSPLKKVLSQGFDDSSWPLQDIKGRYAGEVRLIMHYANAIVTKAATSCHDAHFSHIHSPPPPPPYAGIPSSSPQVPLYPKVYYTPSPYHRNHPHSAYPPPPRDPHYYPPGSSPPPPYPPPPYY